MLRQPHENVLTVLVDPAALHAIELDLVASDLWVWRVSTAPICADGPRAAFQLRRRLVESRRGAWDVAADWVPVWIAFGETWRHGVDPLPWEAHAALYRLLDAYADQVRYRRGLTGVPRLTAAREVA